jgi:hypothetical protein
VAVRTSIEDLADSSDRSEQKAQRPAGVLKEEVQGISALRTLLSAGTSTSPGASDEDN